MALEGNQLGNYRLLHMIGSGGMGEVYLAEDTRINRQVAVKVVRNEATAYPHPRDAQEVSHLFLREMKAITVLDHPRILPFFDFGDTVTHNQKITYMVMPLRPEGALADWLQRRSSIRLSPQDTAHFVKQAAEALQHAHDHQIIHQDVKPQNFLIQSSKEHPSLPDIQLTDFGVAKILSATTTATSQNVRGTPSYMAPEQWQSQPLPASDQYALAIMAYQLLTGQTPFHGRMEQLLHQHIMILPTPPSTIVSSISPALDAVMLRGLEKQPEQRFPSVSQFASAFQQAVNYQDLRATLTVNNREAQMGTARVVTLPGKRQIVVPVPPDAQEQQSMRVEAQGETYYEGGPRGPLFLTLTIKPQPSQSMPVVYPDTPSIPTPPLPPMNQGGPAYYDPSGARNQTSPVRLTPSMLSAYTSAPSMQQPLSSQRPPLQSSFSSAVQARPTKRTSSTRLILLVALALVVIVGSGLAFFVYQNAQKSSTLTTNANSTHSAANNNTGPTATAAAQQNATGTATANTALHATATVISANPNPYPPNKGTLLLLDSLSDNRTGSHWEVAKTSDSNCQFSNGAYHISTAKTNYSFFCAADATSLTQLSNFACEVQMTIVQGDAGGLGFRMTTGTTLESYYFRITKDGYYALILFGTSSRVIISGSTPLIHAGPNQPNTLGVVVNGSKIDLYVNHTYLDSATDTTYTKGQIALVANDLSASTEIAFSHIRLWNFQ